MVITGTTGKLSIRAACDATFEKARACGTVISGDMEIVGGILDISVSGGGTDMALANSSSLRISGGDITLNGNRGYALVAKNLEITGGRLLAVGERGAIRLQKEGVMSVGAGITAQTSESRDGGGAVDYTAGEPEGKWFFASEGITKEEEKNSAGAAAGIDKNVKAGDTVRYGAYTQKPDGEKEPIEWIVLERDGDKALLLSRYALDTMKYHRRFISVNWEECTLREWLNNDFLSQAFSEEEASALLFSLLQSDDSHIAVDYPSDDADRVFLIGRNDYERYFTTSGSALCEPTRLLKDSLSKDVGDTYKDGICWWWLCSAQSALDAYGGGLNGEVRYRDVNQYSFVRPAIWVSVE